MPPAEAPDQAIALLQGPDEPAVRGLQPLNVQMLDGPGRAL